MEQHIAYCSGQSCTIGGLLDRLPNPPSLLFGMTHSTLFLTLAVIGLVVFLILSIDRSTYVINQWDRAVVFRLGRFRKVAGPGLFFRVPIIDSIADWIDMRTCLTTLKVDTALTQDAVPVTVETILTWVVRDPFQAVTSVEDYREAIAKVAAVCMREMIGKTPLTTLMSQREAVCIQILGAITRRVTVWGLSPVHVDIRDVTIPEDLYDAMSRQAQAERERDARVTLAEAEIIISEKTLQAARQYEQSPTALKIRQMGLVYEMGKNGTTILIPTDMTSSLSGIAMSEALKPHASNPS